MQKILIVEDNKMNLTLMKDILTFKNFEVQTCEDGLEALNLIKTNDYDLVLLDIQLPKLSGYEILKKMQKRIKTIVVSACAMENEVEKAKEYGCIDYITKPIHMKQFVEKIEKALNS